MSAVLVPLCLGAGPSSLPHVVFIRPPSIGCLILHSQLELTLTGQHHRATFQINFPNHLLPEPPTQTGSNFLPCLDDLLSPTKPFILAPIIVFYLEFCPSSFPCTQIPTLLSPPPPLPWVPTSRALPDQSSLWTQTTSLSASLLFDTCHVIWVFTFLSFVLTRLSAA